MTDDGDAGSAWRRLAHDIEKRIRRQAPGYAPGHVLPSIAAMASRAGLGVDAVREAYHLLASMGLVTIRRGYGAIVRAERERETIRVPAGTVIRARMPTSDEIADWGLEPGTPMLSAGGEAWPGDRYELVAEAAEPGWRGPGAA